jgi:hypothetical protein
MTYRLLGNKIRGFERSGQKLIFKQLTLADGQIVSSDLCEMQHKFSIEEWVSLLCISL